LDLQKNVMAVSTQMKVNGMTTALNNEYIFKMYFWLTNYSSCQTSEDAHEYSLHLRESYLKSSSHHPMYQMLLKTVWCMMSIYTAQCKLVGTYSAQEYTCRQLHAQNATRFL
jgi:hypothetical protein